MRTVGDQLRRRGIGSKRLSIQVGISGRRFTSSTAMQSNPEQSRCRDQHE